MKPGRQWIALDATYFSAPFNLALQKRFGWAGVGIWIAFLCACKRGPIQGQLTYTSDLEGLALMGLVGRPLIDDDGKEWTLDEFFGWTGKMKQTRRNVRGTQKNVTSTHWEHWQETIRRSQASERQGRLRARKRDADVTTMSHRCHKNVTPDSDSDSDRYPSPLPLPSPDPPVDGGGLPPPGPPGDGPRTKTQDPLAARLVAELGVPALVAERSLRRLRIANVGDRLIDEAIGFAAEKGTKSARYVEEVALDWMRQRDPTWQAPSTNGSGPVALGDVLGQAVPGG